MTLKNVSYGAYSTNLFHKIPSTKYCTTNDTDYIMR